MEPAIEDIEDQINSLLDKFEAVEDGVRSYFGNIRVEQGRWGSEEWSIQPDGYRIRRDLLTQYDEWKQGAKPLIRRYHTDEEINRFDQADQIFLDCLSFDYQKDSLGQTGTYAIDLLYVQKSMLESIPSRVESERLVSPRQQSVRVLSEELEESKRLLEEEIDRAAGVLAGVALERHLIIMAESSPKDVDFNHSDNLTSLAESLRNADIIDENDKKQLVYLAGIRNKCAHADEEDPEHDEVRRLVNQADGFIERYS